VHLHFYGGKHLLTGHIVVLTQETLRGFGTQVQCYIPSIQREGHKTPGQIKTINGVGINYRDDMRAYRVWDIEKRKTREVSFYFSVVSEGFYPFRDKGNWPVEKGEEVPLCFYPTLQSLRKSGDT
jgi:hypothetical protein